MAEYTGKVVINGEAVIDLTKDDVKPEHVNKGIKFHDKTGAPQIGTNTKTVDASTATAEAAEVLVGRTFGKGSELQTGTMPDNSGDDVAVSDKNGTNIPKGYHDGSGKAKIADAELAKLVPANIKEGITILGVTGDFGADNISSQSKEITPTFVDQNVAPDAGYTFLSSVVVKAIPVTKQLNEAGGYTVTVG